MIVDYIALGKRIKIARIRKDLSQEKTAEICNISSRHVSNIETGKTKPSLTTLIAIANALGVSIDEFLCDSILKSEHIFTGEAKRLLSDCNDYEIRIMFDILETTKNSLRKSVELNERLKSE